jgi:uncharacterized protein
MDLQWYQILALVAVGLVVGFINTLAGSGSLISLPLLIFLGLPAPVANGTNRIAILLQSLVGAGSFYRQKVLKPKQDWKVALPAMAGAIFGAIVATKVDAPTFEILLALIMVLVLVVIFLDPKRFLGQKGALIKNPWLNAFIFLAIGFYGGFIQAGVGIFILIGLALSIGHDLIRANAIKNLIVLLYTPLALYIFWRSGQVDWWLGLILAAGNMGGALIGARMAVKRGPEFVKWVVVAVISAYLIWLIIKYLHV